MKSSPLTVSRCVRWTSLLACAVALASCGPGATSRVTARQAVSSRSPGAVSMQRAEPSKVAIDKRASLLTGLSCPGITCVAVGYYYAGSAVPHEVIDTWNGSDWQRQAPAGLPGDGALADVSCASSTSCLAVGSRVLAWNGTNWRLVASRGSSFSAASCVPGSCLAVGQRASGRPAFAIWASRRWRTGNLALPRHRAQAVTVASVSCPSASICMAVGDYSYGAGAMPSPSYRDRTLAEAWTAAGWHVIRTVSPGPSAQLSAVSCIAPDDCTAVGSTARQFPLAERWNGRSWRAEPMPNPRGVGYTELTAVSCASAATCVAVGNYQGLPVAYHWNGRSWRLRWLPRPPADQHSAGLSGVSCAQRLCMAVGDSGDGLSYAEQWNGVSWRLAATPNPG